ncbi:MAG: hypothetical protein JO015_12610 [Verrucomicrobia bacterium]|nr:hypothetical protein [Verrucomicrobiota bacterium]
MNTPADPGILELRTLRNLEDYTPELHERLLEYFNGNSGAALMAIFAAFHVRYRLIRQWALAELRRENTLLFFLWTGEACPIDGPLEGWAEIFTKGEQQGNYRWLFMLRRNRWAQGPDPEGAL